MRPRPVRILSIALGPHEHVRALRDGTARREGIHLDVATLPLAELLGRVAANEFDAGEFSFSDALASIARNDRRYAFLPVFPHRAFRQSMVWTRTDSRLTGLADLRGARLGIGSYATTALLYLRGLLDDDHGIGPDEITWVRTTPERMPIQAPGVTVEDVHADTDALLDRGSVDAVAVFAPPRAAGATPPGARRLVSDVCAHEAEYLRRTGVLPIMHVVALKASIHESDPTIASRLLEAFEFARERSTVAVPRYGIDANRPALDAALRYARRQFGYRLPEDPADLFIRSSA